MPTIAVLIGTEPAHRHSVHRAYADALWAVGATPVFLAPPPAEALDRFVSAVLSFDGVILSGGGDVDPASYGAVPEAELMGCDPGRDAGEIAVARAAKGSGRRLLGICRGIQVLAVAGGGSLHQHLPAAGFEGHWDQSHEYEAVHEVKAEPGSLAGALLGGSAAVNSIHHQGVRDPGTELQVTAWAGDGLVEALEGPDVIGIQWHPERLAARDQAHLAPFRWLIGEEPT